MDTRDLDLLDLAAMLDVVARGADSVDASVPVACGLAAGLLYAACRRTTLYLPDVPDDPTAWAAVLLDIVARLELVPDVADVSVARARVLVSGALRELGRTA